MNEWMNEWMSEWVNEWMSEWVNEWMSEWENEWMSEWVNEWMSEWMSEWMNEWQNEWTNERMNEWTNERMNERMNERTIERTNEGMNGWHSFRDHGSHFTQKNTGFRARECFQAWIHAFPISHFPTTCMMMWLPWWLRWWCVCETELSLPLQYRAPFANLIFQKCTRPLSFLRFLGKSRAVASLVHLLSTSSSKSAPRPPVFLRFLWNWALVTVSCTFCRPHLGAPAPLKSSSRYNPVYILSTTSPDRAAEPRKQRLSFGDHSSHFTRKNTGFRARECFQAWIHTFPISHPSQLLAWWCGCHDDWGDDVVAIMVTKLAMTIVHNSEVS